MNELLWIQQGFAWWNFQNVSELIVFKQPRDRSYLFWISSLILTRKFIGRCRIVSCACVSWSKKKTKNKTKNHTVNSKKYYLCYKDYRIIDSKSLHFVSEMFDSYHLGLSGSSRVFDQHNRGFIKYHNSRTNIYMPACFLTKMAAIGKNDGSEIEQNKTVGLYKWWYCLPNSSNAYTIPLNIIYTPRRSPQDR